MSDLHNLDILTLPLHGQRLIEASAGTGKTYTIAGLYLRLLLGHGNQDTAHPDKLNVDEILVVTFTEAATAELRERIRQRIAQARIAFIGGWSDDKLISDLLSQYPTPEERERCAKDLLRALRQMDMAAIFTIHSFCRRMLTQHAFESGSYFETEFITDESNLQQEAIEQFWRTHFYQQATQNDRALAEKVKDNWKSGPADLLRGVKSYLPKKGLNILTKMDWSDFKASMPDVAPLIRAIDTTKKQINQSNSSLVELFSNPDVTKQLNQRSFKQSSVIKWLEAIVTWAKSDRQVIGFPDELSKFTLENLQKMTKKGCSTPEHPFFEQVSRLISVNEEIADHFNHAEAAIRSEAIQYLKENVQKQKKYQSLLSFDDLLNELKGALNNNSQGALAVAIREQFPLAMIDEFQDTDETQYNIFSTLYGNNTKTDSGLLIIGDPKQAIYSFRGADIHTYIKAKKAVENHYTLAVNYRSSAALVAVVNQLFLLNSNPFMHENDIPFECVSSQDTDKTFSINGQTQHALTYILTAKDRNIVITQNDYKNTMAKAVAIKIAQLLVAGQNGTAKLDNRNIQASDIAVLVRTGNEAKLVKTELEKLNVASVYLSNRESVFQSSVAIDVFRLLQACIDPSNERYLKAALATSILHLTALELDQLNNDEYQWQNIVELFVELNEYWQKHGVLAMFHRLIHHYCVPAKLLSSSGGERQLTDILHLGELLEQQSVKIEGAHALVRWLNDKILNAQASDDEQQLRLESDRNLVQIVTIHKSKGLEYHLVFLPFVCNARKQKDPLYYESDDETSQLVLNLIVDEKTASVEKAEEERLAEDLRLLYVALTRAVYHCWIGMAAVTQRKNKDNKTQLHDTAIGYLLIGTEQSDANTFDQKMISLCEQHPSMQIVSAEEESLVQYKAEKSTATYSIRNFSGYVENNYWLTSYSALARTSHGKKSELDASLEAFNRDSEVQSESDQVDLIPELSIFTFPKGADAGTFLHTLFEEIDFSCTDEVLLTEKITELLDESQFDECWLGVLIELVSNVLDSTLHDGFSMRQLTMQDKLVEMEFLIPLAKISSDQVNQIICEHDVLSKAASKLDFSQIQGMLKGFIDLIFVDDDKYYVLDYKSNHLGDDLQGYTDEFLAEAMISHRYDFQYQLYCLALHRFLRSRIQNYQYDVHIGGVYYLFLRGMRSDNVQTQGKSPGVFFTKPDFELIDKLDQLLAIEEQYS